MHNVPVKEIENQIDAVFEDIEIDAVKLGMLPTTEIIEAVANKLKEYKPPYIVCDPVLEATSGDSLSESGTVAVRSRKNGDMGTESLDTFIADVRKEIDELAR